MTLSFTIKVKVGKFVANILSMFIINRQKRHRLRNFLNPLNPNRCIKYLEKNYTHYPAIDYYKGDVIEDPIWVCWLQGLENAPILVQNCIRSIEHFKHKNQQLIIITKDNYSTYVDMPSWIIEKWEKGIITNTHFSDLFRIHALSQYGGCWIDATCLMTSSVPSYILQSPLFIMHSHGEFSYTLIQSCFICCTKNNYVIRKWCAAMDAYWKQEKFLINYFALHLMFIALLHKDKCFRDAFSQVPIISDEAVHLLQTKMMAGNEYDENIIKTLQKTSFFQKLTYKFPPFLLNNENSIANHLSKPIKIL